MKVQQKAAVKRDESRQTCVRAHERDVQGGATERSSLQKMPLLTGM